MNASWKIGVKVQPMRLPGSGARAAGWSGVGWGVGLTLGEGAADAPDEIAAPTDAGASEPLAGASEPLVGGVHAATRSATSTMSPIAARAHSAGWTRGRDGRGRMGRPGIGERIGSADRVVASRVAGMAAGDALHAHETPPDQPVSLDRLLGVVGAGRLVAALGRQPREREAVRVNRRDPDPFHEPSPSTTPPRVSSRRSVIATVR